MFAFFAPCLRMLPNCLPPGYARQTWVAPIRAMLRVARSGHFHGLLMHQPRRRIACAAFPLEKQRRHVSFRGLSDKVIRREPLRYSQSDVDEQRSRRRQYLGPIGVAMDPPGKVGFQHAMGADAAGRAADLAQSVRTFHRLSSVGRGADRLKRPGHRSALLKLDRDVGHGGVSLVRCHRYPMHLPLQMGQVGRCLASDYRSVQASK